MAWLQFRINKKDNAKKAQPGHAIISSVPGTTRDRREGIGRMGQSTFRLIDTAGVDGESIEYPINAEDGGIKKQMMRQTMEAVKQADLILVMFDAKVGVTNDLGEIARWLRKSSGSKERTIILLANKLEGDAWNYEGSEVLDSLLEVSRLGFGEAIPISAEHGDGLADIAVIVDSLERQRRERLGWPSNHGKSRNGRTTSTALQVAILGRQNVGKSTLVNSLLRDERVITGATPGLTRDAIAIEWTWRGKAIRIVDTAGIRKRPQRHVDDNIEDFAVLDAVRAMKLADVAVLVLDAGAGVLQRQELAIADAVLKEGRSLVIAANKMDLLVDEAYSADDFAAEVKDRIESALPMLRRTPVVAMSSLNGDNVEKLLPVVFESRERWARVISTGVLNRWLAEVTRTLPPPVSKGNSTKIKYIMQTKGRPPTFLLFCNVNELPVSYIRFLTRNFQDTFDFFGMEVRLVVKKSAENPFAKAKKRSGSGLGGRDARKGRVVKQLRTAGRPKQQRRRAR